MAKENKYDHEWLIAFMKKHKLTGPKVAEMLDVTQLTVYRWRSASGKHVMPWAMGELLKRLIEDA